MSKCAANPKAVIDSGEESITNKAAVYEHSRKEVKRRSSLTLLPASGDSQKINLSLRHVTVLEHKKRKY